MQLPEPSIAPPDVRVVAIAITVVPAVHGHSLRRRLARVKVRHRARVVLCVAFALAALGTLIATTWPSGSANRRGSAGLRRTRASQKAAIAAAFGYPYPLRWLTVTVSASDPDYARASVDRTKAAHTFLRLRCRQVASPLAPDTSRVRDGRRLARAVALVRTGRLRAILLATTRAVAAG
jgi:hypothetical protein